MGLSLNGLIGFDPCTVSVVPRTESKLIDRRMTEDLIQLFI